MYNLYKFIGVVFRGQSLDDILRAENERLAEERNALQQNIRQLEQRLESQGGTTEETTTEAVSDVHCLSLYHNCDSTTIRLRHDYHEKLTCS